VMDGPDRVLEVIVPDDQLSLAIGKKGQNVRLASKLVGWQINIKSEEAKKQEILSQMDRLTAAPTGDPLSALEGLGEKTLGRLEEAGVASIQDLAERSMEDLVALPGIGEKTAQRLLAQAQAFLSGEPVGASAPEETGKADEPLTQDEKEVVE